MVRLLQGVCVSRDQSAFNNFQSMTVGDTTTCGGEDNSTAVTLHNAVILQR